MIATPEANTDCFSATIVAYREARQSGEGDLQAYYLAREAYRSHQPNDPDEARNISAIISTASKKNPQWVWKGVGSG
jgi:biotin carboxylase